MSDLSTKTSRECGPSMVALYVDVLGRAGVHIPCVEIGGREVGVLANKVPGGHGIEQESLLMRGCDIHQAARIRVAMSLMG